MLTRSLTQLVDPSREGAKKILPFKNRHANTNAKTAFHTSPAKSPAGRLAQRGGKPNRGSGKEHRALR